MYTQIVTLILKNFRLIVGLALLVAACLALWQYVRTQVQAKTSTIAAQAATAALETQTKATKADNTAVLQATERRATIHSKHSAAIKQAEAASKEEVNHVWAETPIPPDMLRALNGV